VDPTQDQIQHAVRLQRAGDHAGAAQTLRAVLARGASHPLPNALLGRSLIELGRPQEAADLLEPIAGPGRPLVSFTLGMALNRLDRPRDALAHLARACESRPSDAQFLFWHGATLMRLDRIDDAETVMHRAREATEPARLAELASSLFTLGMVGLSADCFERAIAVGTADTTTLLRAATAHQGVRNFDRALELIELAVERDADNPSVCMALADQLEKKHRLDDAARAARRGLELDPSHTVLARLLARLERRLGNPERSDAIIQGALPNAHDPRLSSALLIEHGHVLDALGRTDEAFDAFTRGKAQWLATSQDRFPLGRFEEQLDERERSARDALDLPRSSCSEHAGPVFFVGFPRSGTTLMEQILAAHPGVVTLDEVDLLERPLMHLARASAPPDADEAHTLRSLDDDTIKTLREAYFASVQGALGETIGQRTLVDKMPLNITRLGVIARVFPYARLLIALRDPRDCCLSCLMQSFEANPAMVHLHSIESAAHLYARVMGLWVEIRARFPIPFFEYRYEDLTRDLESSARGVLEFLHLPWDDRVLHFQEQARTRAISTPSYERVTAPVDTRAVARWRRYEHKMTDALSTLAPLVEALGYE